MKHNTAYGLFTKSSALSQETLNNPINRFVIGQAQTHQFCELVAGDFADRGFMGQFSVGVPGFQRRNGLVGAVINDDGVSFNMAEAFGEGVHGGIKSLL